MSVDTTPCWICGGATTPAAPKIQGLLECTQCGFWFRPMSAEEASDQHDDSYFEDYAGGNYLTQTKSRQHEAALRLEWLASLGARPPGRLLEVGSASGYFVAAAQAAGWQAIGVEVNNTMAEHARSVLGVDVRTGMVEDQDLGADSNDLIVMWHVLEHIPEPLGVVKQLVETLKPGGRFAVEVPNVASLEAKALGARWAHLADPHHLSHFTPESLTRFFQAAGLVVETVDTLPFRHYARHRATKELWKLASLRREHVINPIPHPTGHPLLRACARRPDGAGGVGAA